MYKCVNEVDTKLADMGVSMCLIHQKQFTLRMITVAKTID